MSKTQDPFDLIEEQRTAPGSGSNADVEAPYIWAVRFPALASMILTVRANTADELQARVAMLIEQQTDIIDKTLELVGAVEAAIDAGMGVPGASVSDDAAETNEAPAKPKKNLRNIDYELDSDDEGIFDAVKMTVTLHSKKGTPVLNIWDRANISETYAPCQVFFSPAAMARLFEDDEITEDYLNVTSEKTMISPTSGRSAPVAYKLKRSGKKTYVNVVQIGTLKQKGE